MHRRNSVKLAITTLLSLLVFSANAQDANSYPSKPIRIIVNQIYFQGTPAPIVHKLNAAILEALKLPDTQQKMAALGGEVVGGSPADMTTMVIAERARWKKVIETANVKLD